MKKYLIAIITFCTTLCSYGQTHNNNTTSGIVIDPLIRSEVEKNINTSGFGNGQENILMYNNRMLADLYEDDKLKVSTKNQDKKLLFKSFYYWQGDTLGIDGAFGLFGGTGFSIKIIKGKATLYHMVASDDFPSYAYKEKESLKNRLEVSCTNTKIILSELPDKTKKQIIYGYVEFKSGEYFQSNGSAN
jgi:hypothetical protein